MAAYSILRMINTTADSAKVADEKTRKHIDYITRPSATADDLIYCDKVNPNDHYSFGAFRKDSFDTGRPLKHIVISFGREEKPYEMKMYYEATKDIAQYYVKDYQIIAAVHSNIPARPHAHILVDCFNISTGKKFSEGPKELEQFKQFVNGVLKEYKIPLLRNGKEQVKSCWDLLEFAEYEEEEQWMGVFPQSVCTPRQYGNWGNSQIPYTPNPYNPQQVIIIPVYQFFQYNYYMYTPNADLQNSSEMKTVYTTCGECGAILTEKEVAFCNKKDIKPPICYKCQHKKI